MIKSYRDLIRFKTFEERFEYLRLGGVVGHETFGALRYLCQEFYRGPEWRPCRRDIIVRDEGCDLAIPDRVIHDRIIIHHINPITIEDIEFGRDCLIDPDNLICISHNTSQAIHYGNASLLIKLPPERRKGDTQLWTRRVY